MSTTFFMSDPHLQHVKLLSFGGARQMKYTDVVFHEDIGEEHVEEFTRPFENIDEHDDTIIHNINKTVGEDDTLWILGDVSVGGDLTDDTKARLKSIKCKRKNLVLGNHDTPEKIKFYQEIFQKIVGCFEFKGDLVLTHIPVHVQQVETRFKVNIHGHMHDELMKRMKNPIVFDNITGDSIMENDPRYVNVCMEHINMTPIAYDVIKKNLRDNGVL